MRSQAKELRTKIGKTGEARYDGEKIIIKINRTKQAESRRSATFEVYDNGDVIINGKIRVRKVGKRTVVRRDHLGYRRTDENNLYEVEYLPTGKRRYRRARRIDTPIAILYDIAKAVREGVEYISPRDSHGGRRWNFRLIYFVENI